uniref:SRPBCC family protein n=1 Tax=uncultured Sphingomonas sp. TaxID=158754 RepID=UPI0035CA8446
MTIRWPAAYAPGVMPVHVVNTLAMAADPAAVWKRLIAAEGWPAFYTNASNVRVDGGGDLRPGVTFRWRTFGVDLVSTVEEFVPGERIAWLAHGTGVIAYHAWAIAPAASGCIVVTEETQRGVMARLGKLLMPGRMHRQHQLWLEGLARVAMAPT